MFDRTRSGRKGHGPGGIGPTMNDLSGMTPFTNKFFEHSGTVEMSNFKAQVGFHPNNGNYCYIEQSSVTKKGIKTLH